MHAIDTTIFRWFNSLVGIRSWIDAVIVFKSEYLGWSIVVILFLLFLFEIKNETLFRKNWNMGWESLASGILSRLVFTELIHFFWNRPRPFQILHDMHQLVAHESSGSFPSGHAAFFFAIAMSVFFYSRKWGIFFFIIAAYMGIGRIEAGLHWPSDILGGALVGIFSAWIIHAACNKKRT